MLLEIARSAPEIILEELPFDVTLERYAEGPAQLAHALSGLTTDEIETVPQPGGRSIGQILHCLADEDARWALCIRLALTKPGAVVPPEWCHSDEHRADQLHYEQRPWRHAVDMFCANRVALTGLLRLVRDHADDAIHVSGAGSPCPTPVTIHALVAQQADQAREAIGQIEAIRMQLER